MVRRTIKEMVKRMEEWDLDVFDPILFRLMWFMTGFTACLALLIAVGAIK